MLGFTAENVENAEEIRENLCALCELHGGGKRQHDNQADYPSLIGV